MADDKKSSGIVAFSLKDADILPPCTMGSFPMLTEPDTKFEAAGVFNFRAHMTEDQFTAFCEKGQAAIGRAMPGYLKAFREAIEKAPSGKQAKMKAQLEKAEADGAPDFREWAEGKVQEPAEKDRTQLPFIRLSNKATFISKGVTKTKTMRAWAPDMSVLDLVELALSGGSIVQAVVNFGLFHSAILPLSPTMKLQGVVVLKRESFGASSGSLKATRDEAEVARLMGEDFEADDLSAFVGGGGAAKKGPSTNARGEALEDLDEEIPF